MSTELQVASNVTSTVKKDVNEGVRERLLKELEFVEEEFVQVTEFLQKEREHLATFEIEQLLEAVESKHAFLREMTSRWGERRALISEVLETYGIQQEAAPDSIPSLLRSLAQVPAFDTQEFEELACRFEIQIDVISELRDVNKTLVQRALWWIDAYLGDLRGAPANYTATGRRAAATATTLRRTL